MFRIRGQLATQNYYSGQRAQQATDELIASGVEMIELDPEENHRWRTATAPLRDRFISRHEAAGRPARRVVTDLERLAVEHAGLTAADVMNRVRTNPIPGIIEW